MVCGNIGTPELLLVFMLLLLLFGAKKLPALARSIGSGINEFKKGLNSTSSDISDIEEDIEFSSRKKTSKTKAKPSRRSKKS